MAVVFLEIGQDVHFEGGNLEDAVNEGVRQGYVEGYLRKSVVGDPLIREKHKDNTPAVLHIRIVEGDRVKIKVAPKGFGSENMSRVFMLKPADGNRRRERCSSDGGERCRTECLSADGSRCWDRRHI